MIVTVGKLSSQCPVPTIDTAKSFDVSMYVQLWFAGGCKVAGVRCGFLFILFSISLILIYINFGGVLWRGALLRERYSVEVWSAGGVIWRECHLKECTLLGVYFGEVLFRSSSFYNNLFFPEIEGGAI